MLSMYLFKSKKKKETNETFLHLSNSRQHVKSIRKNGADKDPLINDAPYIKR